MDCRVVQVTQGSDEWDALRRCRITASRLGDVMAKPTTKRYQHYRSRIVCELLGMDFTDPEDEWFAHGRAMEPRALAAYAWKYQQPITHDVFLVHPEYDWLGASPDFLTSDYAEGGEIKSRLLFKNYRAARNDALSRAAKGMSPVAPEYRFQVQGCMWLTGFDSWWYVNYYENAEDGRRKLHRIAVQRDDDLIAQMDRRCRTFMQECYELAGLA